MRRNKIIEADMRVELASCIIGAVQLVGTCFGQNLRSAWPAAGALIHDNDASGTKPSTLNPKP